jgi:hypothetical protein
LLDNLIFDRTAEDVANRTAKGFYRYTDLNRVMSALTSVTARYNTAGYAFPAVPVMTFSNNEILRGTKPEAYLDAVTAFWAAVPVTKVPRVPATLDRLNWSGANDIERFIFLTDEQMDRIEGAWFYCDEPYSGEVDI